MTGPGCGQPGHVGDGKTCETCRLLDAFDQLARAKALCREAAREHCRMCGECLGRNNLCDLVGRLRAMGGE